MASKRKIVIDAETARILAQIMEADHDNDLESLLNVFPVDPQEFSQFLDEVGELDMETRQAILRAASGEPLQNTPRGEGQIFLSYYHKNRTEAERLRTTLLAAGYKVWWDQLLEPDQDLYFEMRNAMEQTRVLLVCLSEDAVGQTTTELYLQARDALELDLVYQPGPIVVTPIRFSDCVVPAFPVGETQTLDGLEAIDLFPTEQWQSGLKQLQARLRQALATAPQDSPTQSANTLIQQRLVRTGHVESQHEITQILQKAHQGNTIARNQLWALVYEDIRQIASRELRGERRDVVLSTTMLVHEAYIRLADYKRITWRNRKHFYALSCEIMKRILIDHARRRKARIHGGGLQRVPLSESMQVNIDQTDRLLDLDKALQQLAQIDPRLVKVVECKFFGGLTAEETAEALGMAKRTVERNLRRAKAYLYKMLNPKENDPEHNDM